MTIDMNKLSGTLEDFAADLDIPPSKYQEAVERYESVGQWLERGTYEESEDTPNMYVQGSFRLGTVVRPLRGGKEADYDIDLVCQLALAKLHTSPMQVKTMVGDRLKESGTYAPMLDDEGKRCWTLLYAASEGPGFHLDVLPCVPDPLGPGDSSIAITDKGGSRYTWGSSNPKGFGEWFDRKNSEAFKNAEKGQKTRIQTKASDIFAKVEDVPDLLVRTPLQRAVQIMKRHRDVAFDKDATFAPISIIITTLAATLYRNETDVYSALISIIRQLYAHNVLLGNLAVDRTIVAEPLISRSADGSWYLGNPVNPDENFADRWHEDNHARAKAFFAWVELLHRDFIQLINSGNAHQMVKRLPVALGVGAIAGLSALATPALPRVESPPRLEIPRGPKPWGHD